MIREDNLGNPVIFLSISPITPDSPPQSRELTFSRQATGDRKQECEAWVKQLKEQIASIRRQALSPKEPISPQDTDIIFEDISTSETEQVPAAEASPLRTAVSDHPLVNTPLTWREADIGSAAVLPDTLIPSAPEPKGDSGQGSAGAPEKDSLSSRFHPPDQPSGQNSCGYRSRHLQLLRGIHLLNDPSGTTKEPPVPQVTPSIAPETTVIPTLTLTLPQTPLITHTPTPVPSLMIPEKGVWVKVQYTGSFAGRVGTSGNLRLVNATGDQYYQIPINDGIVEVVVQKQDGSGDVLTVEIYQNGRLVTRSTKATPYGTIELRETVKRGG
jgi:hypothetical protein